MHSQFTDSAPSRAFGVGPSRDSEEQPQGFTYMYSTCVPCSEMSASADVYIAFQKPGAKTVPALRSLLPPDSHFL